MSPHPHHSPVGASVRRAALPLLAVLVAASLGTALLASPAQASRTVAESYAVPSGGTFSLTGHGFGHGHGMSQYGAQGAARQGLSYRQILGFYYPGTSWGSGAGQIRVLISADTDDDVRVLPQSGLRVRDVATGATYALNTSGLSVWRLRTVSGRTVLEYYSNAWHAYLPGGKALGSVAEFYRAGTLSLRVGSADRVYRGALRLVGGNTVDVLSIDEYVKGVVPREMPASWLPAAVQAQAVAARTYGAWERTAHSTRDYQTCDTTSCQVYGGVAAEDSRSSSAVDATANQILTYGGSPAFTQFGSSSGGWTAAGTMPYLVARADGYDDFAGNTVHTWTASVSAAAIQRKWPSLGTLRRILITQRDGNGEWYGRVEKMTLDGSSADVAVSGTTFRSAFGLRSQWFRFSGGTTSTGTSAPPANASTGTTPITARWQAIGGMRSVVGAPSSSEYAAGTGRLRRYERGRIYWKSTVGAHELYGKVMRAYIRRGGVNSRLGFPRTSPARFSRGVYARFEKGTLRVYRSGRVTVSYTR